MNFPIVTVEEISKIWRESRKRWTYL